jgi:hypothetical protein
MQEITPTQIPGRRQRHETPTQAVTSCHATRTCHDVMTSHLTCLTASGSPIQGSTLFTADQMDDLYWFFCGFHTKRVAGVHKLSEVGDSLTVMHPVLCEKKKWRRSNMKSTQAKRYVLRRVTLCTQKESNALSLWNDNLGYQGILEYYTFLIFCRYSSTDCRHSFTRIKQLLSANHKS